MLNANERRAEILATLYARRRDTIENLAFEFGVSRRTMICDIQILSVSAPVYTVSGNGGGVYIVDGCYVGRRYMTERQENLLRELLPALSADDADTMRGILGTFALPKKGERRWGCESGKRRR